MFDFLTLIVFDRTKKNFDDFEQFDAKPNPNQSNDWSSIEFHYRTFD